MNEKLKEVLKTAIGLSDEEADGIIKKRKNELEKVRLLSVMNFLNYTFHITEPAYTFRLLGSIFALEGLVAAKQQGKKVKVKRLIRENIDSDNKVSLLGGFIFSKEYEFRKGTIRPLRHIMFGDFDKDTDFKTENCVNDVEDCSTSNHPICYCVDWLRYNRTKIDYYLDILIDYFYEIRNAVVHESSPVLALPDYSGKYMVGSFSASLIDAYPVGGNKKYFRSYEAGIDPDIFFSIIKNCIKNHLISY